MDIQATRALIEHDLKAVDQVIVERLHSDVSLIKQLSFYIINNGGKRVRPMLLLLAANAAGAEGTNKHTLAATIEFIHTATLLHDDVVDESEMRRGQQTANEVFGNAASVLTGDFLYSRAFQMMVDVDSMHVMKILSEATNVIAEGEVMQLLNCRDPEVSVERYQKVIYCKTAKLFEAAGQLGAVVANRPDLEESLTAFGKHLGNAFQLIDDAFDYGSSSENIGKNIGDDLAEGKPTLPLILACQQSSASDAEKVKDAIRNGDVSSFDDIIDIIKRCNALEQTERMAKQEIDRALSAIESLPASPYKEALIGLANFSISRTH